MECIVRSVLHGSTASARDTFNVTSVCERYLFRLKSFLNKAILLNVGRMMATITLVRPFTNKIGEYDRLSH
jgi:hypothetical protein